jgi:cytochrome c-type biogenesis protein
MDLSSPYLGPLYALIAGILASASPCALAAIPLVIGHMAGTSPDAGKGARVRDLLFFLLGMASALTFVGVIAAVLGRSLILTAPWIRWVAGLAFLVAGASYLGLVGGSKTCSVPLAVEPDATNATTSPSWTARRALSGLAMGALYGLSASPCATPALLSILALVAVSGSVSRGVILLFAYSIGQSVPVAASGLATSRFQSALASSRGQRAVDALRKLGGTVIIGFGLYVILRPYL